MIAPPGCMRCRPWRVTAKAGSPRQGPGGTGYPSCAAPEGSCRPHPNALSSHVGNRVRSSTRAQRWVE